MGRWADAAGWGVLGLVALLAAGGAATAPGAVLLGVPTRHAVLLAVAGLLALGALAGERGAAACCLGLAPVLLFPFLAVSHPAFGALTGPPLFALALAGGAALLSRARVPVARALFFPVVLVVYVSVAARVQAQVGAEGDEPHYLMVADSLLRDGDLAIERDYALGRYRAFHPGDLQPHYRVRGKDGHVYSLHALGLSLLVLPAYALGGYPAASFLMALLAALLALEVRGLLREHAHEWGQGVADGTAWLVALSPPLLHYAGLVFTEVPAALIVAVALRRAHAAARRTQAAWLVGTAIAFLPWLNVRYAALAAILLAYVFWQRPRGGTFAALALPALVSAAGLAAYHQALYGFLDPRRVYGARPELALRNVPEGLQGLLLDQEFGLLAYAPVFVLAAPGLLRLVRRRPALALTGAAMIIVVVTTAAAWPMWRGGWNPPARFLLPVLPALAVGVAAWLRRGLTVGAALLVGWSLWTGLAGAAEPRLVHRDRDGTAPLFRANAGALEWTRLLPGYVLAEPDRRRQALVWGAALVLACVRSRRPVLSAPRLAGAVLALAAASAASAAVSTSRAGGREAVHLVGRPSVSLPGLAFVRVPSARWGPGDLDWGPLYDPNRHPEGAELGSRLPLPPGAYRLALDGEDLAPEMPEPTLEVRPEGAAAHARRSPVGADLSAGFEVLPGERAVSLALLGGRPLLIRAVVLCAPEAAPN